MIARTAWLLMLVLIGCAADDDAAQRTTLRFWHFWSEPAQRVALRELVDDFERQHPTIDIALTELQWGDGKAKLQLAFNAGTAPDVVHLGLDWFAEFDEGGVFANLPDSLATDGRASRWVVNVRALVMDTTTRERTTGLAANDPHNVIKRVLPFLWQDSNVALYTRIPIHADLNDTLVEALWRLHTTLDRSGVIIDRSRALDERLLNGTLHRVLTGPWIVDMARARNIGSLRVSPMRSILNADVLAVSAASRRTSAAHALIGFLRAYPQARRFCARVSDAGFPADLAAAQRDSMFQAQPLTAGFLRTAALSQPLPHSRRSLSIEPIVERMIEQWYDATSREEIARIVADAHRQVKAIESR